MTSQEIAAKVYADAILAQMGRDHDEVARRYTLLSRTEDYIAEMIPLLEPYLGPAELWVAAEVGSLTGPLSPGVTILTLLLEKAFMAGVSKVAANRRAAEVNE